MVNENDVYLVMSTVAVLHEIPEAKNINVKDFEKLLSPPITAIAGSPAGTLISSQRDQVEILIANNKTDFRDISGRKDFAASKIGKLMEYFVGEFHLKVNMYGINFILRVPHSESVRWITENILSSEIANKTGKKVIGGKGTISLKSGRKTWNVEFDASESDKVMVNFNVSEKRDEVPTAKVLTIELKKQWDLLMKLLTELSL